MNAIGFQSFIQSCTLVALMLLRAVPAEAETITVCAFPTGDENKFMDVTVTADLNGRPLKISAEALTTGCLRVSLDQCTDAVTIHVATEVTHKGNSRCQSTPPALKIAMQSLRWDYAAMALGLRGQDKLKRLGLDISSFETELESADSALADLSESAREADKALFAALDAGDYATAQLQANEVASYLRQAGKERLSLAYSSITYLAGFQAMGVDPLATENPLVMTTEDLRQIFLVLSPEGRNVLELYQTERAIPAQAGVWDYPTTAAVSHIDTVTDATEPAIVPPGLRAGQFAIDNAGRLLLP